MCLSASKFSINLQKRAGKLSSRRSWNKIEEITLSKAPVSRKTAKVECLCRKAVWIREVMVTRLSTHDRSFLKPDWNSGRIK